MSKQPLWTPGGVSDWLAHASVQEQLAVAGGAVVVAGVSLWWSARVVKRRTKAAAERLRAARAGRPDDGTEPMDPYIAFVTLMTTLLSVTGMWRVFGDAMHLPDAVRVVACSVLEASGFAFMRLARTDIIKKRPATHHTVIVWIIALLSGGLSAGASQSFLEVVIRISMPLLAVQLCHSWMLPIPSEVTLNQLQKGRRAWRYIKAQRRLERAGNPVSKYVATKIVNLESDRLAKRALMIGDASSVLAASERASIGEALHALGVRPTAGSADPESEGSVVRESVEGSAASGLPESGGSVVREPATAGVRGSVVRESVEGSATGGSAPSEGPWSVEPVESEGPQTGSGPAGLPESEGPQARESEASAFVPDMRAASTSEAIAAAEDTNGYPTQPWSEWERSIADAPADPVLPGAGFDGIPESVGPWVRDSQGPEVRGSVGPQGPWSVVRDDEGPRVRESVVRGSAGSVVRDDEGPRVRDAQGPGVRESVAAGVRESGSEWADPRWSDETGRMARQIVAGFERDGLPMTRATMLEELRVRGGSVASAHRSALYAYARAPHVPAASELEDTMDRPEGFEGLSELLAETGVER